MYRPPTSKSNGLKTCEFLTHLSDRGLEQHVSVATHKKGHQLDVVITRERSLFVSDVQVTDPGLCTNHGQLAGDHFAVTCKVNLRKPSAKRRIVNLRNVRAIDAQELKRDISSSCLSHILTHSSTTADILQIYNSVLTDLMDKHAPLKQKTSTLRPKSPWFTEEIGVAKREKRKRERLWHCTKLQVHHQYYRDQCSQVNHLIRKCRRMYYANKILENERNRKLLFKTANLLLGEQTERVLPECTDSVDLANRFNEFYIRKAENIRQCLSSNKDCNSQRNPTFGSYAKAKEISFFVSA